MITRNSPSTYFQDRNGEAGFEYELVKRFASTLGVELQIETADNIDDIFSRLNRPGGPALAAADWSPAKAARTGALHPFLPRRHPGRLPQRPAPTDQPEGSDRQTHPGAQGQQPGGEAGLLQVEFPELRYDESDAVEVVDLLRMVDEGQIDLTLVESNEMSMNQVYFSNIRAGFDVGEQNSLVCSPKARMTACSRRPTPSSSRPSRTVPLHALRERYYGHVDVLARRRLCLRRNSCSSVCHVMKGLP